MNFEPVPTFSSSRRRSAAADAGMVQFLWTTHAWMSLGLAVSGVTAWLVANTPALLRIIVGNPLVFFGLVIGQFAMVMVFARKVATVSAGTAGRMFLGYALLNGMTLSSIFVVYAHATLTQAFFVTAGAFAGLSVFGAVTKRDLGPMQQFLMVGVIGIVLASIVNMFFQSAALNFVTSCAGVLVFAGLTAYDNQRLKQMYAVTGGAGNLAINGALMLYLDFVNMFLFLLRLFDNRR